MNKLINIIKKEILNDKNVALIGPTNSGKSNFIINELVPVFEKMKKLEIDYLKDCNQEFSNIEKIDIRIIDEFETLLDKEHLERCHPKESPYYTDKYIQEVNNWHKKLSVSKVPTLYLITRNDNSDINYLVKNLKKLDWGQKIKCYKFSTLIATDSSD